LEYTSLIGVLRQRNKLVVRLHGTSGANEINAISTGDDGRHYDGSRHESSDSKPVNFQ